MPIVNGMILGCEPQRSHNQRVSMYESLFTTQSDTYFDKSSQFTHFPHYNYDKDIRNLVQVNKFISRDHCSTYVLIWPG